MSDVPELIVSKLDAARRQLETAIRLYFHGGDPVSIHTLTGAAYQLIRDINAKRGGAPMMIKEHFVRLFKPEDIPAVTRKLNEAQNFFKHADGDSSETLAFRPSQTEMLLLDACLKYRELSGELVPAFGVYQAWFMIAVGRALILPSHLAQIRQDAQRAFPKGRQAFFAECLPLANDLGLPNLNNG